jgi:CDP-diacylglycerol--serine O-phosphatidyltransferase
MIGVAAYMDAIREDLWFGAVKLGGFTLHPIALLFALSGSLMISRIRIPKL